MRQRGVVISHPIIVVVITIIGVFNVVVVNSLLVQQQQQQQQSQAAGRISNNNNGHESNAGTKLIEPRQEGHKSQFELDSYRLCEDAHGAGGRESKASVCDCVSSSSDTLRRHCPASIVQASYAPASAEHKYQP